MTTARDRDEMLYQVIEKINEWQDRQEKAGRLTWGPPEWSAGQSGQSWYTTIYTPSRDDPDDYDEQWAVRISDHPGRGPADISVHYDPTETADVVARRAIGQISEELGIPLPAPSPRQIDHQFRRRRGTL